MKHWIALLIAGALLVAGCTAVKSEPPPAVSPSPAPPPPPPWDQPLPVQEPAGVPLPRFELGQVLNLEVWAQRSHYQRVYLRPKDDGPAIEAVLTALRQAGSARSSHGFATSRFHVVLQLRSGETLGMTLTEQPGPVEAMWQGRPIAIESPDLTRALAALEPYLEKAQKPGFKLWAVDPTGRKEPQLILDRPEPLWVRGWSPDGRYLLLAKSLAQYKFDPTALPYLFDRSTGQLTAGREIPVRLAVWSGNGFYTDWLSHLDLQFRETRNENLPAALALQERQREIISLSVHPDGRRFAALVGHRTNGEPVDLVLGTLDGTGLSVIPKAVGVRIFQIGAVASAAWSPDGRYLAIASGHGRALVRADDPAPTRWLRLEGEEGTINWAPDSRHVWFSDGGIYDLTGRRILNPERTYEGLWLPDGQGVIIPTADGPQTLRLDRTTAGLAVPDFSTPMLFLPDGSLLVWRTVVPYQ